MRPMRILVAVLFAMFAAATIGSRPGEAAKAKPKKAPCAKSIAECPDTGCGDQFDPNLNRRKNIADDPHADQGATPRTLNSMKGLPDPENFEEGGSRDELAQLGEGQKIVVVAYLIAAKPERSGESCNCGLRTAAGTDNHLVLVNGSTISKFPQEADGASDADVFHSREPESVTAEFTPRVRNNHHPNFTSAKVQPLIDDADEAALLVRVTGLLLFDSEHFLRNSLVRVNNWEIHPVFKLEVCQAAKCTVDSDQGWKSLDDL